MCVKPGKASNSDIDRSIRRQKRGEDDMRRNLIDTVADGLNKNGHMKLREVLAIPPQNDHRDALADIDSSNIIFEHVPKNFVDDAEVPHDLAKMILRNAISEAIVYAV
jgi:hypothetical protein